MRKRNMLEGEFELGRGSRQSFTLTIRDKACGLVVMKAEIDPATLALAISGMGGNPITFEMIAPAELIGLEAKQREFFLDKEEVARRFNEFRYLDRDHPHREKLAGDFRDWIEKRALEFAMIEDGEDFKPGWRLQFDGTGTQQKTDRHRGTLVRYDPPTPKPTEPETT